MNANFIVEFKNEIRKMIQEEIQKYVKGNLETIRDGVVVECNDKGECSVDIGYAITEFLQNRSDHELHTGDSVRVYLTGNNLDNAFIGLYIGNPLE